MNDQKDEEAENRAITRLTAAGSPIPVLTDTSSHGPLTKRRWFRITATCAAVYGFITALRALVDIPNSMMNWSITWRQFSEKAPVQQQLATKPLSLKKRAQLLSTEILKFNGERKLESAKLDSKHWLDKDQGHWQQHVNESYEFSTSTMAQYSQKFKVRALAIRNEIIEAGIETGDGFTFSFPTNPIGIEQTGEALGIWAGRLPE